MTTLLNIGLNIAATRSLSADVAKQMLTANGFLIRKSRVVQSDTEPTLVADVIYLGDDVRRDIYQTAVDLRQECIAAYSFTLGVGLLIGPKAATWGDFNPAFFFGMNGKRLAAAAVA